MGQVNAPVSADRRRVITLSVGGPLWKALKHQAKHDRSTGRNVDPAHLRVSTDNVGDADESNDIARFIAGLVIEGAGNLHGIRRYED